ncbi:hypothetical protein L0Z72_09670 [candidate division KSB1 bacterium]|nr:hypothetical protein [candidate division KSB1 bacterium]
MLKKILKIEKVQFNPVANDPSMLFFTATGVVPSGGWKAPQIIPHVYLDPPPKGIYEFDFIAEAPAQTDEVIKITTKIECNFKMANMPHDLKGVKVYSSSNSKVVSRGK